MEYAKLVELGEPDFIEIKSVTFPGKSKSHDLTMESTPWHEKVRAYGEAILGATEYMTDNYGLACEHHHSCCILLAKKKYHIDGRWHTWIDYPRFHQLVQSGKPFTAMDYIAETPDWAVWGAEE